MRRVLALLAVVVVGLLAFLASRSREPRPLEPAPNSSHFPRADVDLDSAPAPAAREIAAGVTPATEESDAGLESVVVPEPGCTVTFALTYDDASAGAALSPPQVSCTDERGRGVEERTVDAHTVVAAHVRPGRHRVHAYVPGHEPAYAQYEVLAGEREKRVELRFDPMVASASRQVLVRWQTEDGAPFVPALANAWTASWRGVLFIRHERGGGSGTPVPSQKNAFRSAESVGRSRPGAPTDSFALVHAAVDTESLLEACLDGHVLAAVRVALREDEVVFRTSVPALLAQLGGVRGCVVGADDRVPIAGARASIDRTLDLPRNARTDGAPGCFSIDGQMPGTVRLRIEAGGAELVREVEIEPGRVLDLGEIAIPAGCSFRARIVDASGRPVSGARILCLSRAELQGEAVRHFGSGRLVVFDRAEVSPAPVDDAILLVEARGYGLVAVRVPDCGGREDELEVRLTKGFEVVLDLGLGDRTPSIRLATADGTPLGDLTTTSTGLAVVELAPGEYVARRRTEGAATHFRVDAEPLQVSMH